MAIGQQAEWNSTDFFLRFQWKTSPSSLRVLSALVLGTISFVNRVRYDRSMLVGRRHELVSLATETFLSRASYVNGFYMKYAILQADKRNARSYCEQEKYFTHSAPQANFIREKPHCNVLVQGIAYEQKSVMQRVIEHS